MAETETESLLDEKENTEITLGTGKLLGIFFGLVVLCAVFFSMGYMLGRNRANTGKTEVVAADPTGGSPAGKPSAVDKTPTPPPVSVSSGDNQSTPSASSASASSAPAVSSSAPAALVPASSSAPPANASGAYMVQVAAVSKHEDADILVSALQKKQYPAFVGGAQGDALFHVLVGPFNDPKDAETMRARLAGDGYNAIVKR